jgi:hypothetical protein
VTTKLLAPTLTRAAARVQVRVAELADTASELSPSDAATPGAFVRDGKRGLVKRGTVQIKLKRQLREAVRVDIELPSLGADQVRAVQQFAEQLPVILVSAQREHFEQRARSLLQAYPLPDPLGDAHLENYRDELLARQRYLQSVPCWTSKDVADAARHANKNAAQTAYRWKSEGKIFSIPAAGKRDVYPAFQFKDGKPREVMAQILERLNAQRTPWEIAQWFIAPNGWLDGDRPIDLLDDADAIDDLLDAAEQEVAANVG